MRSTDRFRPRAIAVAALLVVTAAVAACSSPASPQQAQVPRIQLDGTRAHLFTSLSELAAKASAIIVAAPTGQSHSVPLPAGHGAPNSAPTEYVHMTVTQVLRGTLAAKEIDLVSPGIDLNTGKLSLLSGGPYLLFVTPAMFAPDDPAGGYVAVGGPAGVYARVGAGGSYQRVDSESVLLPAALTGAVSELPAITKTEAQLLHEGP